MLVALSESRCDSLAIQITLDISSVEGASSAGLCKCRTATACALPPTSCSLRCQARASAVRL
eukprot:6983815-Alexandrium_andersonii.AAC.1